jgi:ribonucleotide monophosphatase NagD (HAD superfamily)
MYKMTQLGQSSKENAVRMTDIDRYAPFLSHQEKKEQKADLEALRIPSKYMGNIMANGEDTQVKLDIDGCEKGISQEAMQYSIPAVNTMMRLGIPLVFLTNDGGSLEEPKAQQLNSLGYKYVRPEHIVICTRSCAEKTAEDNIHNLPVVYFGTPQLEQALQEAGQRTVKFTENLQMNEPFILVIGEQYPRRDWTPAEESNLNILMSQAQQIKLTNTDYDMPVTLPDGSVTRQKCLGGLIEPYMALYGDKITDCGKPSIANSRSADRRLQEVYGLNPENIQRDILLGDMTYLDNAAQRALEVDDQRYAGHMPQRIAVLIETGGTPAGNTRSDIQADHRPDIIVQDYSRFFNTVLCPLKDRYMEKIGEIDNQLENEPMTAQKSESLQQYRQQLVGKIEHMDQMYARGGTPNPSEWSLISADSKSHKDTVSIAESRRTSEEGKAKAKAERLERTHHIAEGRSQERPKDQNKGCCLVM